jgi:hypothetical protein
MALLKSEEGAVRLLEWLGDAVTVLGGLLGVSGAPAASAIVAEVARATAEAMRRKGVEQTLEHIRMPPRRIGDWPDRP